MERARTPAIIWMSTSTPMPHDRRGRPCLPTLTSHHRGRASLPLAQQCSAPHSLVLRPRSAMGLLDHDERHDRADFRGRAGAHREGRPHRDERTDPDLDLIDPAGPGEDIVGFQAREGTLGAVITAGPPRIRLSAFPDGLPEVDILVVDGAVRLKAVDVDADLAPGRRPGLLAKVRVGVKR